MLYPSAETAMTVVTEVLLLRILSFLTRTTGPPLLPSLESMPPPLPVFDVSLLRRFVSNTYPLQGSGSHEMACKAKQNDDVKPSGKTR